MKPSERIIEIYHELCLEKTGYGGGYFLDGSPSHNQYYGLAIALFLDEQDSKEPK